MRRIYPTISAVSSPRSWTHLREGGGGERSGGIVRSARYPPETPETGMNETRPTMGACERYIYKVRADLSVYTERVGGSSPSPPTNLLRG